jgi:colicin import membrane protein/protein TonB
MAPEAASALTRRDRFWPAVALSAVLHALLVGWTLSRPPAARIDLGQKPIVAKLVRLGERRPEELLPRKEAAPPPAAAATPPAVVQAAAPPPRAPAPQAKAAPTPAAAPAARAPAAPGKPAASLSSILSKVQRDVDEKRWGDAAGDPDGDSDVAEGDQYLALVDRALRANYKVPSTIPDRERLFLEANIVLWIEPDGRISRWQQERSSGNATFDAAVERTLRSTTRVPPPPDHLRDSYRKTGVTLVFQARQT